ncbi:MAG: DUF1573 domain-containing protein [Prevotella sp.]|nr:DUF1573 domain-containing protein [Prevotella sp.]
MLDTLIVVGLATINMGTIQEANGPQQRTFCLRNAGTSAVTLHEGYTSCGCTTIHFAKGRTLAVGDTAHVTLRFNPRGKGGEFEETGTIVYGRQKKRANIALVGTCITSEETLMRQFPIRISDQLRLSTDRFDLGYMRVGESKERTVVVLHRDEQNRKERIPIRFTADSSTLKGLQHIPYKIKTKSKGKTQELTVVLDVIIK